MAQNPVRIAAAAENGLVVDTLLEAVVRRNAYVLDVGESLDDLDFDVGEPPLAVIAVATGYVYFLDTTDTTTADDGLTCLVSGNGLRYHIEDAASISLNSVLSVETAPPGSPVVGDAHIVGAAATGGFSGYDHTIAVYTRRGWIFANPEIGLTVLNEATGENTQFTASGWGPFVSEIPDGSIYPQKLLFAMGLSVEAQQNAPPGSPTDGQAFLVGTSGSGAFSGHNNEVAQRTAGAWVFISPYGGARVYDKTARTDLEYDATAGTWAAGAGSGSPSVCEGRLTTETGVAVSTSDRTAQATIYFTPFRGNRMGVYTGSQWSIRTFAELSLSLSGLTTAKPYDVFVYDNAGTLTLEALVWTNDTTRATSLTTQDGILVKSGATTRRYLGTFYTTATGQTEDSAAKRMVWNAYNRVSRPMRRNESTDSWSYATASWRQARAQAANQIEFVVGLAEDEVAASVTCTITPSSASAVNGAVAVGFDSTTAPASGSHWIFVNGLTTGLLAGLYGSYRFNPAVGRHYLAWLEFGGTNATEFLGDNGSGSSDPQSGIHGTVMG